MKSSKHYAIEWFDSRMATFITAENEEEATSKFKAHIDEKYQKYSDEHDLITEIREL